ncbi:MAG TPA: M20/M25/M40 family metallo-hydrolase [Stellaceae bacterium]|nr:M20/M25/M40 family metallo-hydrolase [Stellaceae bacterium]
MSELALHVRGILGKRQPDMLALLETLTGIDSGSYDVAGVAEVQAVIADVLARQGFAIDRLPVADRAPLLRATLRQGGRGRLLILGHADTVWPKGTVAEWPFVIDGDTASAPGVGDMKAALVMACFALDAFAPVAAERFDTITFLVVSDEELGSVGSRALIEAEARRHDWALTLEPARPGGGLVTARNAVGAVMLRATGVTAHSGVDYARGRSAVRALAGLVTRIEAMTDLDAGLILNCGIFRGGVARQVVPAEAEIHLDLRAASTAALEAVLHRIDTLIADATPDGVTIERRGGLTRPAWRPGVADPLYTKAAKVADALAIPIFAAWSSGGSDGSFPAGMGIPTLDGLGPVCRHSCSRDEVAEISSIAQRGALFAGLLAQLPASLD